MSGSWPWAQKWLSSSHGCTVEWARTHAWTHSEEDTCMHTYSTYTQETERMDTLTQMSTHTRRQTLTILVSWLTGRMLPEDKRPHSRYLPQKPLRLCSPSVYMTGCNINTPHTGKKNAMLWFNVTNGLDVCGYYLQDRNQFHNLQIGLH